MKRWVLLCAGLLAIAGSATYAAIPDSQGVIHACYKLNKGDLRVVDSGCTTGELPLSWNQVGPQGAAGPPGVQGPQGPAGPSGVSKLSKLTTKVADTFASSDAGFHERVTLAQLTKTSDTVASDSPGRGLRRSPGRRPAPARSSCGSTTPRTRAAPRPLSRAGEGGDATLVLFPGVSRSEAPLSDTAFFGRLPSGVHSVTVWVRATEPSDTCTTNTGVYPMAIDVEEIP